ncbi:MAG: hypothetical protein ACI81F_002724 [Thalassolituus oleivorans]|jgi:hypothetical protein
MAKHPGTSGLMPVKGSGCGIRPDPDALAITEGFDFSGAAALLANQAEDDKKAIKENGSAKLIPAATADTSKQN